jgi:hypothetical protein
VLSPATAAFDRGMKFAHYRQLSGLQEYLLIDPATPHRRPLPQGFRRPVGAASLCRRRHRRTSHGQSFPAPRYGHL